MTDILRNFTTELHGVSRRKNEELIIETLTEAETVAGVRVHERAFLLASKLVFSPELLEYCKSNVCGNYNKSWTCPPACESMEEQREKILSFENVFVFTTTHKLEDSFDYEGMTRGMKLHTLLTIEFKKRSNDAPVYGAGSCPVCDFCAFPSPCPFPEKKIGSIEAAGINVTELSKAAGIAYNNGPNTVTFFSISLYNRVVRKLQFLRTKIANGFSTLGMRSKESI